MGLLILCRRLRGVGSRPSRGAAPGVVLGGQSPSFLSIPEGRGAHAGAGHGVLAHTCHVTVSDCCPLVCL